MKCCPPDYTRKNSECVGNFIGSGAAVCPPGQQTQYVNDVYCYTKVDVDRKGRPIPASYTKQNIATCNQQGYNPIWNEDDGQDGGNQFRITYIKIDSCTKDK